MNGDSPRANRIVRLLFALCGLAATAGVAQTLAELASYDGPDRTARLVAGAKLEGSLLFYTSTGIRESGHGCFQENMASKLKSGAPVQKPFYSG